MKSDAHIEWCRYVESIIMRQYNLDREFERAEAYRLLYTFVFGDTGNGLQLVRKQKNVQRNISEEKKQY